MQLTLAHAPGTRLRAIEARRCLNGAAAQEPVHIEGLLAPRFVQIGEVLHSDDLALLELDVHMGTRDDADHAPLSALWGIERLGVVAAA